jgi:hypothetical protein
MQLQKGITFFASFLNLLDRRQKHYFHYWVPNDRWHLHEADRPQVPQFK